MTHDRTISCDDGSDAMVVICDPLADILLVFKHSHAQPLPHPIDPLALVERAWGGQYRASRAIINISMSPIDTT